MRVNLNCLAGLVALGVMAASTAVAQNPAAETPCSVRGWDGPCRPDYVPANNPPPERPGRPWERPAATRPGGG